MNDADALALALGASRDLEGLRVDVSDIKGLLIDRASEIETPLDAAREDDASDASGAESLDLVASVEDAPADLVEDVDPALQMAWAQTALLVVILAVLFLQWGTQLWQCFSDKWRS